LFSLFVVVVVVVVVNCCGEIDLCFVAPPNCRLSAHLKKEGKKERKKEKEGRKENKIVVVCLFVAKKVRK
jgi:hypothetical protein